MTIGEELKKIGLKVAYKYLDRDPEANMPKLMDWVDRYTDDDILVKQRKIFRQIITTKDDNWYKLLYSLWDDIDDDVRKALFENIVINANANATVKARESRKRYNCNIPWALVLDISDEEGMGLTFDETDDIIEQAKELGTFMFVLMGKSIEDRKEEIIAMCNKHKGCQFMCFSLGKEIDEDFADQLLRVKNMIPTLLLHGDARDESVLQIMDLLHSKKLPYGGYCFYDKENMEKYAREDFFDKIIEHHGKFCFFFSNIAEDEDTAYSAVKKYREFKPLLTINFCKDKAMTGGCIAGGRYYCSINSRGDVMPCLFMEESDSSIKDGTLLEAYKSPLFMTYKDRLPICDAKMELREKR